ncbi:MAG: cytochrome c biogenesis protein CcsA [Verrucomicrobiota bacterium JB023]|nr:cytochrome c biogenesis protein CcsA [Verrucomicrobiota bacterium JB023]
MIERWLITLATALVALAGWLGVRSVSHEAGRSKWTSPLMGIACVVQLMALSLRGEMRQACPLGDLGEDLLFLAWSLTLFYLLVGRVYRLSLLGIFTSPVVVVLQVVALVPGVMSRHPEPIAETDGWRETHAALSVLSFGAFALSAVSGVMFLVLNRRLKAHHTTGGLFDSLPSVHSLVDNSKRLLVVGLIILTIGIVAGFLTPGMAFNPHLILAAIVWFAYLYLAYQAFHRGLSAQKLSIGSVALFLASLVFFILL